jgi:hypothetical protein
MDFGWEGTADKILDLHRAGPGVVTRTAAAPATGQTEGERLISLIHEAGPGRIAPKCIGCLGKTTACTCADEPGCPYSPLATVRKLQELLDAAWVAEHQGPAGANKYT